jgi:CTP synthase (UTP-ammonia lyase)
MEESISVALVGDHDPSVKAHIAIPKALDMASQAAGVRLNFEWVATPALLPDASERLAPFDALWCVPASPYESMEGALDGIRYAREQRLPFLGTCGGYQHAVLEYARSVLGHADADNAEVNPGATLPLIAPMSCALVEETGSIRFVQSSYIYDLYQNAEVEEGYHCSYGVHPEYLHLFEESDLVFSGFDCNGEPRSFELRSHPFFLGTAYQPERTALAGRHHPLVTAFVRAAAKQLSLCTEPDVEPDA